MPLAPLQPLARQPGAILMNLRARATLLLLLPVAVHAAAPPADALPRVFLSPAERAVVVTLRGQVLRGEVTSGQVAQAPAVRQGEPFGNEPVVASKPAAPVALRLD